MQSSFTSTAIRLFRYLDALQIAFIRAVLEQPKCRKALRLGLLVVFLLYMVSQVTASADDSLLQLDKIDDKFRGYKMVGIPSSRALRWGCSGSSLWSIFVGLQ